MEEMRHDIEFAASFGNFVPGTVYFTLFHVEKSTTSIQQMQVCVAGCCGYVTVDIMTRSGSGG